MAFGTWRSPFPRQFGGGATKRMDRIYNALKANLGTALSDDEASANMAEIRAMARTFWIADRSIDRRIIQADPRRLTTLLERTEAFLGIVPGINNRTADRIAQVAIRLLSPADARCGSLSLVVETAFSPWTTQNHYTGLADAIIRWPGGTVDPYYPWYSTICNIVIEYVRPNGATDAEVDVRRAICLQGLDAIVPAWATFAISETVSGYDYGFYADISRVDFTCVD
jgi:hypothetical protein